LRPPDPEVAATPIAACTIEVLLHMHAGLDAFVLAREADAEW